MNRLKKLLIPALFLLVMLFTAAGIGESAASLPAGLRIIEEQAFYGSSALQDVRLPDGVQEIRSQAFAYSSLTSISLPASLSLIADNAFDGCSDAVFYVQPDTYADRWCEGRSVNRVPVDDQGNVLPSPAPADDFIWTVSKDGKGVTITGYLGDQEHLIMPSMIDGLPVTTIDNETFVDCVFMTRITLPETLTFIESCAFVRCSSLTAIHVDADNDAFASRDGVLFSKDMRRLICCPSGMRGSCAIPDGVSQICPSAFSGCVHLTSITLPDSLETINELAFSGCASLTGIFIPAAVNGLDCRLFEGCTRLTAIDVDADNEVFASLGGVLFNRNMTELIAFPAGKTGAYEIPDGVETIGIFAFNAARNLTTVTIPAGVVFIEDDAFDGCRSVELVVFEGSPAHDWCLEHDGIRYTVTAPPLETLTMTIHPAEKIHWVDGKIQSMLPRGSVIDIYDVETGVIWRAYRSGGENHAEIEPYQQDDTRRLCLIYGVDSPEEIADQNLYQRRPCLVTVDGRTFACSLYGVPHNANADTIVDNGVDGVLCLFFTGSTNHSGNADSSHDAAIDSAYRNAPNGQKASPFGYLLTTGNLNLRSAPSMNSERLDTLAKNTVWPILGNPVEVNGQVWYPVQANELSGYVLGDYVTKLTPEQQEVYETTGEVPLPPAPNPATDFTYARTADGTGIVIESYIGKATEVIIPSTIEGLPVVELGCESFYRHTELTRVVLPDTLQRIGLCAFDSCTGLTSIDFPPSLTTIEAMAFLDCSSLTSLHIHAGVTNIDAFRLVAGCSQMTAITVDSANPNYTAVDGVLYTKDMQQLLGCPGGKSGVVIVPEGVTTIIDGAFFDCALLKQINLPDSLAYIDELAITGCYGLSSITLPAGVTYVASRAFVSCPNLSEFLVADGNECYTAVDGVLFSKDMTTLYNCPPMKSGAYTVPTGVQCISDFAFENCVHLTKITLPDSVTDIYYYAFDGCTSLTTLVIPPSVTMIDDGIFDQTDSVVVHVTAGSYAHRWCRENAVPYTTGGYVYRNQIVTAAETNLMSLYSSTYVIATIPAGTILSNARYVNGRYRVSYNGSEGYVAEADVTELPVPIGYVQTTLNKLNVRKGPGSDYAVADQVATAGTVLNCYAVTSDGTRDWYLILYNGRLGYVLGTAVQPCDQDGNPIE